jgi:hypothetical protein
MTVERASNVNDPSTIIIDNVSVKLDRTVPFTNDRPYQIVVWGNAIAPNFGMARDQFPARYAGIMADYIRVVSSPDDMASILTNEVIIIEGELYVIVNGVPVELDVAPFICPVSNSFMVPLRVISEGLGLRHEMIVWSDIDRSVTITLNDRVIQVRVDDPIVLVNGVPRTMQSPDFRPVSAQMVMYDDFYGRVFLPFRALGETLGVATIDWEPGPDPGNPGVASTAWYNRSIVAQP